MGGSKTSGCSKNSSGERRVTNTKIGKIAGYDLVRKLGEGADGAAYLAYDKNDNCVVIKTCNPGSEENFDREVNVYMNMQKAGGHDNVATLIQSGKDTLSINTGNKQVKFMVLERIDGRELFDFVDIEPFQEPVARYFFKQFVEGVKRMHNNPDPQYAHRDIKMENVLIDQFTCLKIIDMGHAGQLNDWTKQIGTSEYWSPEQHQQQQYRGDLIDVFQMGLALYLCVFFEYPFLQKASPQDRRYKYLYKGELAKFWSQQNNHQMVSDDLKDLLVGMLSPDNKRYSIADIEGHPWLQGPVPSEAELQDQVIYRMKKIAQNLNEEFVKASTKNDSRKNKQFKEIQSMRDNAGYVKMSGEIDNPTILEQNGLEIKVKTKEIDVYEDKGKIYNYFTFFTDVHPYFVDKALRDYLESNDITDIEGDCDENKYELKFDLEKEVSPSELVTKAKQEEQKEGEKEGEDDNESEEDDEDITIKQEGIKMSIYEVKEEAAEGTGQESGQIEEKGKGPSFYAVEFFMKGGLYRDKKYLFNMLLNDDALGQYNIGLVNPLYKAE